MTQASDAARAYSRASGDKFLQELFEMLRIPSLSGDPAHAGDIRRMAEWLEAHMAGLGLDKVEIMQTAGHPVVYGEWLGAGPDKPTVLVYGHYDVVPAEMADGWDSDPFEPVVKDGKIYARGATDDKGQLFIHVKALESYLKTSGAAPVNVKFLLEGEEEVSSPNLRPFIEEHLELLRADVCVISDTSMRSIDEPAILHSLRGMTYIEVEVRGPRDDLHSGLWGGAVHNPALALVEILAKMYNPDNTIAVPGFYDDVVPLTAEERAMIAKTDLTEAQYKQSTGVPAVWGDAAYNIRERISARPTLDVNGLWSGWSGPGPKTIVPAKAGVQAELPAGGQPGPAQDLRAAEELHRVAGPAHRHGRGPAAHHRQAGALPLRHPGHAGGRARLCQGLGRRAALHPRRRQHPRGRRHRRPDGHSGGADGLRAGRRRPALAQRALQHRDVPARHRDDDRLSGGVGAT